jgi:hypothetical protein
VKKGKTTKAAEPVNEVEDESEDEDEDAEDE